MKRLINYLKVKLNEERMFEEMYLKDGNAGIASLFTSNIKMLEESISILNGEIRESCGEFCTCGHLDIIFYGQICDHCGKPVVLQNSQERTE